jgi:hypothetical protein
VTTGTEEIIGAEIISADKVINASGAELSIKTRLQTVQNGDTYVQGSMITPWKNKYSSLS